MTGIQVGSAPPMSNLTLILAALFAFLLLLAPAACGDDPGEDRIGDGQTDDEGD